MANADAGEGGGVVVARAGKNPMKQRVLKQRLPSVFRFQILHSSRVILQSKESLMRRRLRPTERCSKMRACRISFWIKFTRLNLISKMISAARKLARYYLPVHSAIHRFSESRMAAICSETAEVRKCSRLPQKKPTSKGLLMKCPVKHC